MKAKVLILFIIVVTVFWTVDLYASEGTDDVAKEYPNITNYSGNFSIKGGVLTVNSKVRLLLSSNVILQGQSGNATSAKMIYNNARKIKVEANKGGLVGRITIMEWAE